MGFSAGQVQYLDLIKKDTSKLFNEEVMVGPRVRKCCSSQLPTHILLAVRLQLPGEQCRPVWSHYRAGGEQGEKQRSHPNV